MGDIDFKVISAAENSNKFQKNQVSSMISRHIWLFKKPVHTLQNNVHMSSFPIL